jgi:hypothetical protein
MSWKLPVQGRGKWLALFAALVVKTVVSTEAQPAQLALSSQIQYSQVIQGGVDPINAFVYNTAPVGAAAGDYQVTAAYGVGLGNSFKISYQGIRTANGGSVPSGPLAFNLQTASIAPGVVPVAVTLKDTTRGGSITQAGQVTVLAHAAPSLFLGGSPVSLSSRNVITFQTTAVVNGANVFAEAVHAPGGPGLCHRC